MTSKAMSLLADAAARLTDLCALPSSQRAYAVERLRQKEVSGLGPKQAHNPRLVAALHILMDLTKQGWPVRVHDGQIEVARPTNPLDPEQDRLRIRNQLHAERDEQLRQESVRVFIKSMAISRFHDGKRVSVFSLMRDGRDLAAKLRAGEDAIKPYLQFVFGEEKCRLTGMRLVDIWRYFRHTWTTPYKSVPGRTMMIIIRDEAAPFHPVIGIAALSSATVGLSVRDEFIGWTFKKVWQRFVDDPSPRYWRWMIRIADSAINEIYKDDLLRDGTMPLNGLKSPTPELIQKLIEDARHYRKSHYRLMESTDYKQSVDREDMSDEHWEAQAKSPLFRAKREQELAGLLQIRASLNAVLGKKPTGEKFVTFLRDRQGQVALTKLIRKAKADRVGTVIADLTICGAVPPYNDVLGGKLVAMLVASPEVVAEYRRRYKGTPSIIASSMAGRSVVRPSELVYISTTSLYGRRPNQYDRISIPAGKFAGTATRELRYHYLKKTKGLGTFQFGQDAVEAMSAVLTRSSRGQRVNSVFGEGTNPRLRKIRDGLDELGLPSNTLLDHGAPRLVYGLPLIENLTDYLLGIDDKPKYIVPPARFSSATRAITGWWFERWCKPRLSDEAYEQVERHILAYPIKHGAAVVLPPSLADEPSLFDD